MPERIGARVVLRIYSGTRGARSSIRVAGGTAWPSFDFGEVLFPLPTPDPAATWTVEPLPSGAARWRPDSVAYFDLREVVIGDVLVVTGPQFQNQGSFPVIATRYAFSGADPDAYIDVLAPEAVMETTVQCLRDEVRFFRPVVRTIRQNPERVLATQQDGSALVSLAATARAVGRGVGLAAYPPDSPHLRVLALTRGASGDVSVTTSDAHGLFAGSQFDLLDVVPDPAPAPTPGAPASQLGGGAVIADQEVGLSDTSLTASWSSDQAFDGAYHKATVVTGGDILVAGGVRLGVSVTPRRQAAVFHADAPTSTVFGRQYSYRWRSGAAVAGMPAIGHALAALGGLSGQAVQVGGYLTSPWADLAASNYPTVAHRHAPLSISPWISTSAVGFPNPVADAAAVTLADGRVLITGGSQSLNTPYDGGQIFDPPTNSFSFGPGLLVGRAQASAIALAGNKVLVIGGRRPYTLPPDPNIVISWDFEEQPPTASNFGSVIVLNAPGGVPRPAGKAGWAVRCTQPLVSTGGANQTSINAILLADPWTVHGWATSDSTGCIVQNGTQPAGSAPDNAQFALGIDPTDRKFVVRWQRAAGVTIQKKTTGTVDQLWPGIGDGTYRRWHHFALVRVPNGANQTVTLYLDGVLAGTWTDLISTGGSGGTWAVGRAHLTADTAPLPAYTGCVDELVITTTAMTAYQAGFTYRAGVGVTYDAPPFPHLQPVGQCMNTCEVLDVTGLSATQTGSMTWARFAFGTCVFPDGRILVVGGVGYRAGLAPNPNSTQHDLELRSAEIYDPIMQSWGPLPDMAEPHSWPVVAMIGDKVYVAGGFTSKMTEVLDTRTMTWATSAPLPAVAGQAAGGLTGAGVILVAGGLSLVGGVEVAVPQDMHALPGADTLSSGGLNGRHTVLTVPAPTEVTFATPDYASSTFATTGELVPASAPADPQHRGPYVADAGGPMETFQEAALTTERLDHGGEYSEISVDDATVFPDEPGYLVLAFGSPGQIGPIRYLGRAGANRLVLGAVGPLPTGAPVGTSVRLANRGAAVPQHPFGWAYATGTTAGRVAAERTTDQISATGIDLEVQIRYPGDRALGGEGQPTAHASKLSSVVEMYAGDDIDAEMRIRRGS